MEIRKADSKGRVTGFEPGELYVFHRHLGHFHKVEIKAPDGEPVGKVSVGKELTTEDWDFILDRE